MEDCLEGPHLGSHETQLQNRKFIIRDSDDDNDRNDNVSYFPYFNNFSLI